MTTAPPAPRPSSTPITCSRNGSAVVSSIRPTGASTTLPPTDFLMISTATPRKAQSGSHSIPPRLFEPRLVACYRHVLVRPGERVALLGGGVAGPIGIVQVGAR